jgi:hypothetical protein
MWTGEIRARASAGTLAKIDDDFTWGGEVWHVVHARTNTCWMSEKDLSPHEPADAPESDAIEVDVTTTDAHSWLAVVLDRGGWLARFDEDDTVTAIRIDADLGAFDALSNLADVGDPSSIAKAIRAWLDSVKAP